MINRSARKNPVTFLHFGDPDAGGNLAGQPGIIIKPELYPLSRLKRVIGDFAPISLGI